jgi:glycosyltransferase involved in cell wall biosynthesis
MKKVGFITSPLTSGNAVRGVGFYAKHLLNKLILNAKDYGFEIHPTVSPSLNYDLVHYPFFDPFIHSLPIYKITKTIITIHDIIPLEYPQNYPTGFKGRLSLELQKLSLNNISGVITDSFTSVNSIHKYLGIPDYKIKLVYLAAADTYKRIKVSPLVIKKYSLPKRFVLYVGDVNWNKNLPRLIKSCLSLNIDLVLVGKQLALIETLNTNHPELEHLKDIKYLLSSPLIHRLGFVPEDDLAHIYNLATLYCQPSYAEGFGLPVLEAMSCGTPVVCSNSHSLPEIAENAVNYFNPENQLDLTSKLADVLNNSHLQKQLSQKGLLQSTKFTWDQTAKNTLQAYKNFL